MSELSEKAPASRRVGYADLVRVVAVMMVVLIHAASPLLYATDPGTADFRLSLILDALSHAGVPLFVMASGMFLLDQSREVPFRRAVTHYALPLVGLYFFWSFLYAAANKVILPVLTEHAAVNGALVKEFIVAVFEGAYHMWYLPMMIFLYLITPLLRRFVRAEKPVGAVVFLLVAAVLQFGVYGVLLILRETRGIGFIDTYDKFYLGYLLGYPAYYVAGWLIARRRPGAGTRCAVYAAGIAALAGMILLTDAFSLARGEIVPGWLEPLSPCCAVYGVAVFAFFAWEMREMSASRRLAGLSRLTFGVYIVHVEFMQLFKTVLPFSGTGALVYILLQWVVVAAVSWVAAFVLSKIPLLKKSVRM